MKLTPLAQKLWDYRQLERRNSVEHITEDMDGDIDALASEMGSENFGYALFDGGYLKPAHWVEGADLEELEKAVALVEDFKNLVEELHHEF